MIMPTYLKVSAITALTGFSQQKVQRDCLRFKWPYIRHPNSPIRLFEMSAVQTSYGIKFEPEKVSIVAHKLNKIAVFVRSEK